MLYIVVEDRIPSGLNQSASINNY